MKMGRTEIDGVVMYKRSWGVLRIDIQDDHLLNGWSIIGKKSTKNSNYISVILRNNSDRKKQIRLSRLITNAPKGMVVDHINHDPTDNRRCNLRVCDLHGNAQNRFKNRNSRSRFKGVIFRSSQKYNYSKNWRAYTTVKGVRVLLGWHKTDIEAAMAYNRYANLTFGEFACFNRFDCCPVFDTIHHPLSYPPAIPDEQGRNAPFVCNCGPKTQGVTP